jgi:hypothetical protein
MSKSKIAKAPTKAAKPALSIKKDGKGRFWVVPKDGKEHGPFDNKKHADEAKKAIAAGGAVPETKAEAKTAKTKKVKEPKAEKVSAIEAAAQLLAGSKEPMNCKALIEAMAAKGLWTSPGGKTPHATLYSAILREINEKGKEARFKKTDRGHFAINA